MIRLSAALIIGLSIVVLTVSANILSEGEAGDVLLAAWIVFSYFLIGVASISVVQLGYYRLWMSWAFGIADISIVLCNLHFGARIHSAGSVVAFAAPATFFLFVVLVSQLIRIRPVLQVTLTLCLVSGLFFVTLVGMEDSLSDADIVYLTKNHSPMSNAVRFLLVVMIGIICILVVWRARRLAYEVAQQKERERNATRFLSPELAGNLSDRKLDELRQGRVVWIVVMFVDIRGFTEISEAIGAHATTELLTEFRSRIEREVTEHDGVIDKFIGDGAMIVFGLNESMERAAQHALKAAEGISATVSRWSEEREGAGRTRINVVMSLHAGTAVAGAIGDAHYLEFGVFGSVVNEASRIETFAKQRNLQVAVSDAVLSAAGADAADWVEFPPKKLRGRSEPIRLFGLSNAEMQKRDRAKASGPEI
ncbi:adenylate/guanylate cyclase domain-containing protein [Ruegeria arenilitoris]|uniref:adenylate/guanylate cyclase domain-containing protein n=1 Tax=Ruegeria arenilitoris TaxID=1173585 RepID=UPI00147DB9E8